MAVKTVRVGSWIMLLLAGVSQAATTPRADKDKFRLELEIKRKNALLASPKVVTELGHTVILTRDDTDGKGAYVYEITPSRVSRAQGGGAAIDAIQVTVTIHEMIKGQKRFLSRPKVITLLGQSATIAEESATDNLEITVTPFLQKR